MEEETLRRMAIEQYLQGKTPVSIYQEMGRSKKWFFKWLHRYQSGDPFWHQERSRRPHFHPHQVHRDMRKLVTNIRIQLDQHPYAQVGTSAIKWEFEKLGVTPPADRTINRILKREGMIKKNSLYPQRSGVPLFQRTPGVQPYPSGRPSWPQIHQGRWSFLFAQCHGSLQPSNLSPSPTGQRRPGRGSGLDQLLEGYGHSRLSSSRQRTLFSREQSLSPLFWDCPQTLPSVGDRGSLHPYKRTLAQWCRGELQ